MELVSRKLLFLGILVLAASVVSVTPASSACNGRHILAGAKSSWASAVPKIANLGASQRLSAQVWLAPRNGAQLTALAAAVSDPSNALYTHYLTSRQYQTMFAPTPAQVAAVGQWLTGSGLHIDSVGPDNAYVAVSGTTAAVNSAFGTQMAWFTVKGRSERAPAQDVSVPGTLAATVMAVTGLTTFGHRTTHSDLGAPSGFRNATPCSSYYAQQVASTLPQFNHQTLPFASCGYVPSQFRGTYGVTSSGKTGAGQTVAITDAFDSSHLLSDANQYSANRGESAFGSSQFVDASVAECDSLTGLSCAQLVSDCGGNGWYGEQNLDVEAVHGMATAANVRYYGAGSCYDNDLLAALAHVVSDNKASIVTNSWGEPTFVVLCDAKGHNCQLFATIDQNTINAYESVFKHGAVQGIGFYFSSGDNGDELAAWGYKHPDWPTGDPWVTSVGGTSLAINSSSHRSFETGWGTAQYRLNPGGTQWKLYLPFQYGAGGGYSQIFPKPNYQRDVVGNDPTGGRAVPDIGLDGDPTTGMLIGITQNFPDTGVQYGEYRIGGTSLSSPLFAGLQAAAQQGRSRIGFANPLIYSIARHHAAAYFDVTPQGDLGNIRADFINGLNSASGIRYSVRTFDQDSSLVTGTGWDDVTGVGAPTAAYISATNDD